MMMNNDSLSKYIIPKSWYISINFMERAHPVTCIHVLVTTMNAVDSLAYVPLIHIRNISVIKFLNTVSRNGFRDQRTYH